ncbi:MAG: ABC transporter permease [Actinomycetota bacterium]
MIAVPDHQGIGTPDINNATIESTTTATTATAQRAAAGTKVRWHNVIRGEWIKFRSVRSTKITLLASGAAMVLLGIIFSVTAGSDEPAGPATLLTDPVQLALAASDMSAMIIGVLGVLLIAGEYSTGLIRTTIAAVGDRLKVLGSKAVVLAGVSAVVVAISSVLALWLGQAVYAGDQATMALTDPDIVGVVLGTTTYLVGIGLIGLALGAILRSTAAAIGLLVGGVFIVPGLMTLLPDWFTENVVKFLPSEAGSAMMSTVSDPDLLSTGAAYGVFAAWVVGLLGVAAVLLKRRDA